MKKIIFLTLIMNAIFICFAQNNGNNCYSEKIMLCINPIDKQYKDTVLNFRNYIEKNDEKRIVCNDWVEDKDLEKLIWECKYIATDLQYLNDLNKFSIILYNIDRQDSVIVHYFLCDRISKEAYESRRFLIANKKIIGMNRFPGIDEEFVPIEEFDRPRCGHSSPME